MIFLLRAMLNHEMKYGISAVMPWLLASITAWILYIFFIEFLSYVSGVDEYTMLVLTFLFFMPVAIVFCAAFFLLDCTWIALWLPWSGIDVDSLRQKLRRVAGM
ncbi:hypothetical protein I6F07_06415 [Ensifer sp. IC4062]|nr:hypothetical protein [Ensifer sp. IC4062]MCA1439865.1 hypothetical protein [Ensifer sp. IC4062]